MQRKKLTTAKVINKFQIPIFNFFLINIPIYNFFAEAIKNVVSMIDYLWHILICFNLRHGNNFNIHKGWSDKYKPF